MEPGRRCDYETRWESGADTVAVCGGARFPWSDPVIGETREGWGAGAEGLVPSQSASQKTDDAELLQKLFARGGERAVCGIIHVKNGHG